MMTEYFDAATAAECMPPEQLRAVSQTVTKNPYRQMFN